MRGCEEKEEEGRGLDRNDSGGQDIALRCL